MDRCLGSSHLFGTMWTFPYGSFARDVYFSCTYAAPFKQVVNHVMDNKLCLSLSFFFYFSERMSSHCWQMVGQYHAEASCVTSVFPSPDAVVMHALTTAAFFIILVDSDGRAAVDGSGYDGIRGAGSGPILARDNVQR